MPSLTYVDCDACEKLTLQAVAEIAAKLEGHLVYICSECQHQNVVEVWPIPSVKNLA